MRRRRDRAAQRLHKLTIPTFLTVAEPNALERAALAYAAAVLLELRSHSPGQLHAFIEASEALMDERKRLR